MRNVDVPPERADARASEMIWGIFAVMTGLATLAALWPLSRRPKDVAGQDRAIAFHRAQLAEIERDVERGQLPPEEAHGARAEAGRRLIAAADAARAIGGGAGGDAGPRKRLAAAIILVVVPVATLALYGRIGRPDLPDQPILARQADPTNPGGVEAALAKLEAHLIVDPNDGKGYAVAAPVYMGLERYDQAARAYSEALRLLGDNPVMRTDYGEALVAGAGGVVTAQARLEFEAALAKQPALVKARFYLGLAAEQDGDAPKAVSLYEKLLADEPGRAPWAAALRQRLAKLKGETARGAAAPNSEAAAIASLAPDERKAAVRGMVERLATRLAQRGDDAPGWLRLIRAYSVLQETDKARGALSEARKALAGNPTAARDLDALAAELGIGS